MIVGTFTALVSKANNAFSVADRTLYIMNNYKKEKYHYHYYSITAITIIL